MATASGQTTVTNTATPITAGVGKAVLRNRGLVAVYIGTDNTVTTATGLQLDPGESLSADLMPTDSLYGITASSSAAVHWLLVGDGT